MLKIGLVLLLVTLGACRESGGANDDAPCEEDDEQSFCCWNESVSNLRTCAVTAFCEPGEPLVCYPERITYLWFTRDSLRESWEYWEAQPCHSEDVGLRGECE